MQRHSKLGISISLSSWFWSTMSSYLLSYFTDFISVVLKLVFLMFLYSKHRFHFMFNQFSGELVKCSINSASFRHQLGIVQIKIDFFSKELFHIYWYKCLLFLFHINNVDINFKSQYYQVWKDITPIKNTTVESHT